MLKRDLKREGTGVLYSLYSTHIHTRVCTHTHIKVEEYFFEPILQVPEHNRNRSSYKVNFFSGCCESQNPGERLR